MSKNKKLKHEEVSGNQADTAADPPPPITEAGCTAIFYGILLAVMAFAAATAWLTNRKHGICTRHLDACELETEQHKTQVAGECAARADEEWTTREADMVKREEELKRTEGRLATWQNVVDEKEKKISIRERKLESREQTVVEYEEVTARLRSKLAEREDTMARLQVEVTACEEARAQSSRTKPCTAVESDVSSEGGERKPFVLASAADYDISYWWVDGEGLEHLQGVISSHEDLTIHSFAGHVFRFRSIKDKRLLLEHRLTPQDSRVVIPPCGDSSG